MKVTDVVGVGFTNSVNRYVGLVCQITDINPDKTTAWVINGAYYIGILPTGVEIYGAPGGYRFIPNQGIVFTGPCSSNKHYNIKDYNKLLYQMNDLLAMGIIKRFVITTYFKIVTIQPFSRVKRTRLFRALTAFKTVWAGKYYHNEVDDDIPF